MKNQYYVSECPDTKQQFLVETGKDGNIIELTSDNVHAMGLLESLKASYNEYKKDVLPLVPDLYSDHEDDEYRTFDEAKNDFLESLWDVIQQHFDDALSDEHDPEKCGCTYVGNNMWNCGHIDQLPVERPITDDLSGCVINGHKDICETCPDRTKSDRECIE